MSQCLATEPYQRPSARAALLHPYFLCKAAAPAVAEQVALFDPESTPIKNLFDDINNEKSKYSGNIVVEVDPNREYVDQILDVFEKIAADDFWKPFTIIEASESYQQSRRPFNPTLLFFQCIVNKNEMLVSCQNMANGILCLQGQYLSRFPTFLPNPKYQNLARLRALGCFLAKCVIDGKPIPPIFPPSFYKYLLGKKCHFVDLEAYNPNMALEFRQLLAESNAGDLSKGAGKAKLATISEARQSERDMAGEAGKPTRFDGDDPSFDSDVLKANFLANTVMDRITEQLYTTRSDQLSAIREGFFTHLGPIPKLGAISSFELSLFMHHVAVKEMSSQSALPAATPSKLRTKLREDSQTLQKGLPALSFPRRTGQQSVSMFSIVRQNITLVGFPPDSATPTAFWRWFDHLSWRGVALFFWYATGRPALMGPSTMLSLPSLRAMTSSSSDDAPSSAKETPRNSSSSLEQLYRDGRLDGIASATPLCWSTWDQILPQTCQTIVIHCVPIAIPAGASSTVDVAGDTGSRKDPSSGYATLRDPLPFSSQQTSGSASPQNQAGISSSDAAFLANARRLTDRMNVLTEEELDAASLSATRPPSVRRPFVYQVDLPDYGKFRLLSSQIAEAIDTWLSDESAA